MAIVMLALNGEGLGHLIRATIVCNALRAVGGRPVIFSQGVYQPDGAEQFPSKYIPSLWRAPNSVRQGVAGDLYSMAAISLPAVVVEDTHPNPITLPGDVRRVLMVRPTSFEYLTKLAEHQRRVYSAFVLCDAPESPTWPYTPAQTEQLMRWDGWHVAGPIYRTASDAEIADVRRRYALSSGDELCVFTMGGGGVHEPNDRDVERFMELSIRVADRIQRPGSRVRLIFVKGPYFPANAAIPGRFEVVRDETQMPALLSLARGAVVRAGFNTLWECLAAGTPFMPLVGTTVAEPVQERLAKLERLGLLTADVDRLWSDDEWRAGFRRISEGIVRRHPGRPDPEQLYRLIAGGVHVPESSSARRSARRIATRAARGPSMRLARGRRKLRFSIRIDNVTRPEPTMMWLLDLLASRRLRASLEIVPYLAEFEERTLSGFDPDRSLFEVSQHGYAHVPRSVNGGRRHEFAPESRAATQEELALIGKGRRQLAASYPERFTGGFSPPFDALPAWLPGAWHEAGGRFVSCLYTNSIPGTPLRVVRAGIDIWNWAHDRAVPRSLIRRRLAYQAALDGHIGIVLHPRCLRSRWEQQRLVSILDFIERSGIVSTSVRQLAESPAPHPRPRRVGLKDQLRALLSRAGR